MQPQSRVRPEHRHAQRLERATTWHVQPPVPQKSQPSQQALLVLGLEPKRDALSVLHAADVKDHFTKEWQSAQLAFAIGDGLCWAAHACKGAGVEDADGLLVAGREVGGRSEKFVDFSLLWSIN